MSDYRSLLRKRASLRISPSILSPSSTPARLLVRLTTPLFLSPHLTLFAFGFPYSGRIIPNRVADHVGSLNCLVFMCSGAGIMVFAMFGAGTPGGLIAVAIIYGFFSGGYNSLFAPALLSLTEDFSEIGMRLGMAFLVVSLAVLTGTPINGALLARFGFYAPIIYSGVFVCTGAGAMTVTLVLQRRAKGTWKV